MKDNKEAGLKTYGFTRINLLILVVSMILITVGYVLLSGGHSADGVSFDTEVFNTMRTSIAPVILTIGYIGIVVAVVWKDKSNKREVRR